MHYGSFPGFYSLITIVPDLNVGIFTSMNGGEQDYPWTVNSLIHTFALDLALDQNPWLSEETSCTFPPGSLEMMNTDPFVIDKSHTSQRPLEDYVGMYYHPIFNNATFYLYNRTHLQAQLSDIRFYAFPRSEKDSFTLLVIDKGWYVGPATITFSQNSGGRNSIDSVQISFLEPSDPPTFKRPPLDKDYSLWRQEEEETCRSTHVRESSYRLVSNAAHEAFSTSAITIVVIAQALVLETLGFKGR